MEEIWVPMAQVSSAAVAVLAVRAGLAKDNFYVQAGLKFCPAVPVDAQAPRLTESALGAGPSGRGLCVKF